MPLCIYLQLQCSTRPLEIHLIKIQHILYKLLNGNRSTIEAIICIFDDNDDVYNGTLSIKNN